MLRIPVQGVNRWLHVALQLVVIQGFYVLSTLGALCTKAVPIQRQSKKVHVLRRLPAACSNWDKSWAWLTKVDCGTKYRLDYVTVPPREGVQYKIEYGCCTGDTKCESEAGMVTSDEKFLAIILGSTAAALLLLVLVIIISLCHKRRQLRCPVLCDGGSHIYETAEDIDEGAELQGDRRTCVDETTTKVCESEYEEIRDCHKQDKEDNLPRYADIFGEKQKLAQELGVTSPGREEAFHRATAPPLPWDGSADHVTVSRNNVQEVLSGTAQILAKESDSLQCTDDDMGERIYYNIGSEQDSVDMQNGGGQPEEGAIVTVTNDDDTCAAVVAEAAAAEDGEDCKSKTDCSNYDKLIEPDTLSEDNDHEYQKLVDATCESIPGSAATPRVNDSDKCVVETSQPQVTMNGHLESQSC